MTKFSYRAVTAQGQASTGAMEAPDAPAVRRKLREQGLAAVDVRQGGSLETPASREPDRTIPVTSADRDRLTGAAIRAGEADRISLALMTKLHQLVKNGMPLGDAVKALHHRLTVPRLKMICGGLWQELSRGANMGQAMRKFPQIFDATSVAMIEAGEAIGSLAPILSNLVELIDARRRLRRELMAGLAYPSFILCLVFFVMLFVLFYLMPNVQTMMDSMGGELTLPTRLVMGFARFSLTGGPFILVALGTAALLVRQWRRSESGRLTTDRWLLQIPIVRGIVLNAEICRMCNLATVLLGSGVDTTDALRLIERAIQNRDLRGRFAVSRTLVNDGASFASAFRRQQVMPAMDLDILDISEDAGDMESGFRSIYGAHDEELRDQMKRLTAWIATGALLFVFGLVFLLVFGIVSSILQLSRSVLG